MSKHVPRKQPLYQVSVENTQTREVQVIGPAMQQQACDMLAASIAEQIRAGRERTWANPTVTRAITLN